MATGTNVGDRSPFTGNRIVKTIVIPSKSSKGSSGGSSGGSSSGGSSRSKTLAEAVEKANKIAVEQAKKIISGGGGSSGSKGDSLANLSNQLRAEYESKGYNTVQAAQLANAEAQARLNSNNVTRANLTNIRSQIEKQRVSSSLEDVAKGKSAVFYGKDAVKNVNLARKIAIQRQNEIQRARATSFGTIKGKFYTNLTTKEIEDGKLSARTFAIEIPKRSYEVQRTRDAQSRLARGVGTSADLLTYTARGKKEANLFDTRSPTIQLRNEKKAENVREEVPFLTVSAVPKDQMTFISKVTGLGELSNKFQRIREELRFKRKKDQSKGIDNYASTTLKLWGATIASSFIDFGRGFTDLPETAFLIFKNPSLLRQIPKAIKESTQQFQVLLRTNPDEAFVRIGSEIFLMKGSGTIFDKASDLAGTLKARVSPNFSGNAKIGEKLTIVTKTGKKVQLEVVGRIPKQTLRQQANLIGKKVNAISSQADELIKVVRRSKTVKKPLGDIKLTNRGKTLLNKFDSKKINPKELKELDLLVKKAGSKGLLERSFFADPTGKIRPSRLGIKSDRSTFKDILLGDITFKKSRPQILFFEEVQVENLPKALQSIKIKLKKGQTLTKREADALLRFQLSPSGKFKPIGFMSGESEITLAPSEILKRVKKVGVTIIDGRKVDIVQVKVVKVKGNLQKALDDFRQGSLNPEKARKLDRFLKKETGLDYGISKYTRGAKYVNIKGLLSNVLIRSSSSVAKRLRNYGRISKKKSSPKKTSKTSSRRMSRQTSSPRKTSKASSKRMSRQTSSPKKTSKASSKRMSRQTSSPKKTSKASSSKSSKALTSKKLLLKLRFKSPTWGQNIPKGYVRIVAVRVRIGGRNKTLPFKTTVNRARKYIESKVDRSTSRSYELVSLGIKKGKDIRYAPSKKFRPKLSKGSTVLPVVEKTKYAIDTRGEKQGLKLSRLIAKRRFPAKKKKVVRKKRKTRRRK